MFATCSGVTISGPWPTETEIVSLGYHLRCCFFAAHSVDGTMPAFSPSRSILEISPKVRLCEYCAILSVDAEARAGVVEEDVAGNFDCVRHRHRAVSLFPPAAEAAPEEDRAAAAIERRSRTDGPVRQTGHGHHGLENRSRRVHTLNGAIELDLEWIRHDCLPNLGRESLRVDVRIECRRRHHGQHFAVARIEGHG